MTLCQIQDICLQNLGFAQALERYTALETLANAPNPPLALTQEQTALEAQLLPIRTRLTPLIHGAAEFLAQSLFPMRQTQDVTLDENSHFVIGTLLPPAARITRLTCGELPLAFQVRDGWVEVFADPCTIVTVHYLAACPPATQPDDEVATSDIMPPLCVAHLATSYYCAQQGQRAAAAFWDARWKDEASLVKKQPCVRLRARVWR